MIITTADLIRTVSRRSETVTAAQPRRRLRLRHQKMKTPESQLHRSCPEPGRVRAEDQAPPKLRQEKTAVQNVPVVNLSNRIIHPGPERSPPSEPNRRSPVRTGTENLVQADSVQAGSDLPTFLRSSRKIPPVPENLPRANRPGTVHAEQLLNPRVKMNRAAELQALMQRRILPDRRTISQVTSDQYTNSGYDRGHLASSYSIAKCFGTAAQLQTFLMSNVVPQRHAFNAGIWKSLEMKEINTLAPRCQSIWIITGPIYPDVISRVLPSGIPVPEAFYKIILDEIDGRLRAMAFIIEHDLEAGTDLADCLVSIDEIEKRTGLDFFTGFPETVQTALEGPVNSKIW